MAQEGQPKTAIDIYRAGLRAAQLQGVIPHALELARASLSGDGEGIEAALKGARLVKRVADITDIELARASERAARKIEKIGGKMPGADLLEVNHTTSPGLDIEGQFSGMLGLTSEASARQAALAEPASIVPQIESAPATNAPSLTEPAEEVT